MGSQAMAGVRNIFRHSKAPLAVVSPLKTEFTVP